MGERREIAFEATFRSDEKKKKNPYKTKFY